MTTGLIKFRSFPCYCTARPLFLRPLPIPSSTVRQTHPLYLCIAQQVRHALPFSLSVSTFKFLSLLFYFILHYYPLLFFYHACGSALSFLNENPRSI